MSLEDKFEDSVIYMIQCTDNYYYIGSTRMDLKKRIQCHKKDSKILGSKGYYSKHLLW